MYTVEPDSAPTFLPIYRLMMGASDVRAQLGLARPDDGLRKSKPEPQALKSLSWPKPWAQAAALHT